MLDETISYYKVVSIFRNPNFWLLEKDTKDYEVYEYKKYIDYKLPDDLFTLDK